MAVSLLAQLLASALLSTSAEAQDSGAAPAAAPPVETCGSPVFDPKHDCKVIATGSAKLQCMVMADGSLQSCTVMSEDPPGKGFGDAALATAKTAKVRPDPARPAAGILVKNIPFTFKPDQN
jgi:TonB family protein